MDKPVELPNIRIITVSGRIGAGSTSLAKHIAKTLSWKHIEGGEIFWEAVRKKMQLSPKDTNLRPDEEDVLFDKHLTEMLKKETHIVLETKLAGFLAQGLADVFKIAVICEENGEDRAEIRIDRLVNREQVSIDDAKAEVFEREHNDLTKWRKLYVNDDPDWVYWDKQYFDLTVNTFDHNQEESRELVLKAIGYEE
jgi:predicted cytidylate kinase